MNQVNFNPVTDDYTRPLATITTERNMTIITLNELDKFQDFLIENIKRDSYEYIYLINCLDLVFTYRKIPIDRNSRIIKIDDKWIIYIETPKNLFLYGKNYNNDLSNFIFDHIDLNKHYGKEIMGNYNLVYDLLKSKNKTDYEIIKDRLFFKTRNTSEINITDFDFANEGELNEVIELFQEYYKEEYNGERNKSKEYLQDTVLGQIKNGEIYVIRKEDKIVSFCSLLEREIGIMYTRKEQRKKGYGKQVLYATTEKLLSENGIAYVMTDMHNTASNKVCEDVGYTSFFEHTNLKL